MIPPSLSSPLTPTRPLRLSGVFATNSGIAPHAALPHPLAPTKHMHHVWVRNGAWDHSVRPFRPNNTSLKTSQNRLLANFEPVRDAMSRLGISTILPLQHHNTRQMGCPEVQNGRHASARRISRVCSACPDAGFQVPYPQRVQTVEVAVCASMSESGQIRALRTPSWCEPHAQTCLN